MDIPPEFFVSLAISVVFLVTPGITDGYVVVGLLVGGLVVAVSLYGLLR